MNRAQAIVDQMMAGWDPARLHSKSSIPTDNRVEFVTKAEPPTNNLKLSGLVITSTPNTNSTQTSNFKELNLVETKISDTEIESYLVQLKQQVVSCKSIYRGLLHHLGQKSNEWNKLSLMIESEPPVRPNELAKQQQRWEAHDHQVRKSRTKLQRTYSLIQMLIGILHQHPSSSSTTTNHHDIIQIANDLLIKISPVIRDRVEEFKSHNFRVTVYGASKAPEDTQLYKDCERLGELLANSGYHVITGGYYGTMEAVSKGAAKIPGAKIEGITCSAIFPIYTSGNSYLTQTKEAYDLCERASLLIQRADAFICMPGNIGTLAELMLTWNASSVETLSSKAPLVILAWREPWARVMKALQPLLHIPDAFMSLVKYVDSLDECMIYLEEMRQKHKESKVHIHELQLPHHHTTNTPVVNHHRPTMMNDDTGTKFSVRMSIPQSSSSSSSSPSTSSSLDSHHAGLDHRSKLLAMAIANSAVTSNVTYG